MKPRLFVMLMWFFVLTMVGTGCSTLGFNDKASQDIGSKVEHYADDSDYDEAMMD